MNQRTAIDSPPKTYRAEIRYNWPDNPDIQKLLDVVCEIIANEYIEVARRNKDVFGIASSGPSAPPRNDEGQVLFRNDKGVKNEGSDIR